MDKLRKIMARCKAGVYLTVNQHRDYYQSAEDRIKEVESYECPPEIPESVRKKMIETNTVICLQCYPDTPIGFYVIYHYDLGMILEEMCEALEKRKYHPYHVQEDDE